MLGFGYDRVSDHYKTVGIYCGPDAVETIVKVYLMGGGDKYKYYSNSWRTIQSLSGFTRPYFYSEWCGIFMSATLNWLATRIDGPLFVVSVDLGKETCSEVFLPDVVHEEDEVVASHKLWDLGRCLCLSCDFKRIQFVLWQMQEYGVKESWTKLLNISYQDVGFHHFHHHFPIPIFMLEKGEVLLQIKDDGDCVFILYNPRNNNVLKYLEIHDSNWCGPRIHIERA